MARTLVCSALTATGSAAAGPLPDRRNGAPRTATNKNNIMAKSLDWIKTLVSAMLDQFDVFTTKVGTGPMMTKYGITAAQVTASRNDYLWARHAVTVAAQFEQEWRSRVSWKDSLLDGPKTAVAATVPSIGSEFSPPAPPAVPDGILLRWREFVGEIKAKPNYDKADGFDMGIEAVENPAQSMKPTARCKPVNGHSVRISVRKDGHDATCVWCRRGDEVQPVKLGVYLRATFLDTRENLVNGKPEVREYTFQYMDGDTLVGEVSDICRVTTTGWSAAA